MTSLYAAKALLPGGWADGVRLTIADGRIESVDRGRPAHPGEARAGIVIPGLCNAHSHAFQRALAGRTERRSPQGKDDFWSWRSEMYRLARAVDADAMMSIARQVYAEMLAAGYTTVAEFHYLHDASAEALLAAAEDSGIRLTFVPVLYERAGFDGPQPEGVQLRFIKSCDDFVALYEDAKRLVRAPNRIGIGIHSLRAVSAESVDRIAALARSERVPFHLHIAEQMREVDQCEAHYKARPVQWLLDRCEVDPSWCLVHATHMEPAECAALAGTGAVVCLCPSTEANLGDGLFPLRDFLDHGGRIAIGSDSHVTVDPFEELRWLEYGQRLAERARNVSVADGQHSGSTLFGLVAEGGARACGSETGRLEPGTIADLVVLDDTDPMFAGHDADTLLDALVFSGYRVPVERVMVHGEWRVRDGRHVREDAIADDYRRALGRLA